MLYPSELQALPQPRGVRLAQDFDLCLGRMLKRFASSVLASLRGQRIELSLSDIGITGGDFPFAKIHSKGERPTQSAVCTSSPLRSLRPCWTNLLSIRCGPGPNRSCLLLWQRRCLTQARRARKARLAKMKLPLSAFRLLHPSRFSRMSRESRGVRIRRVGIPPLLLSRWPDEALPGRWLPPAPSDLPPRGMWRGAARSG
jgi:hypothetical protein